MNIFENTIFDKFKTLDVGRPQTETVSQNLDVRRLPRSLGAAVEAVDMTRPEIEPVEKQAMEQAHSAFADAPAVTARAVQEAPVAEQRVEAPASPTVAAKVPVPQDKKVEDMTAQEMKDFRFPFRDPNGKEPVPPGYVASDGYEPKAQAEVQWPERQPTPQTMEEWKAFRFPTRSESTLAAAARAAGLANKEEEDDQDTGRSEGVGGRSQVQRAATSYSDSNAITGVSGVMGLAGGQADESPDRRPSPNVAPAPTPDEDPLDALRRALDVPEPERPAAPSQSANLPRSLGEAAALMAPASAPSEDPLDALHRALDAPDANEPVQRPEISRARRMRP